MYYTSLSFSITIYVISSLTIIDTNNNNSTFWSDDFTCDPSGVDGWNNCNNGSIISNQQEIQFIYHGPFNDIDGNSSTLSHIELYRDFQCSQYGLLYVSFTSAFDCADSTTSLETVDFYSNNS
eukprot:457212_1